VNAASLRVLDRYGKAASRGGKAADAAGEIARPVRALLTRRRSQIREDDRCPANNRSGLRELTDLPQNEQRG
jgi:hypothetical protein